MPREARLIIKGVCYHVMSRGNEKKTIFKNNGDYAK